MGILGEIVGAFVRPTADKIGAEIAASLRSNPEQSQTQLDTDSQLQIRTLDWQQKWDEFIRWQKRHEERPHMMRATEAFSEFDPERILNLVLDGRLKTTGEEDKTAKLSRYGLARQEFGIALTILAIPLGLLFVLAWFGGFILFFVDADLAIFSFVFGGVIFGVLTFINKSWPYSVRLTPLGTKFVHAELLPAILLFLNDQENNGSIK